MNKSPLKQFQAWTVDGQDPNAPTTTFDASNVTVDNQKEDKLDDYGKVFQQMKREGFSDAQMTYVLKNMKAKKDYEAAVAAEKKRVEAANAKAREEHEKKIKEQRLVEQKKEEKKVLDKKEKLDSLGYKHPITKGNWKTWVQKDEDDVIAALQREYPNIDFTVQTTGSIGNEIQITGPGLKPLVIDLNPGFMGIGVESGRETALAQFNTFEAWAKGEQKKVLTDGASLNLFKGVDFKKPGFREYFENDDLKRANSAYESMGIEIVPIRPGDGGTVRGVQQYNVISKETGEILNQNTTLNPRTLQKWLANRDNFSEEQKIAFNDYASEKGKEHANRRESIKNDPSIQADKEQSDISFKTSPKRVEYANVLFEGISEEGKTAITSYLNTPIVSEDGEYEPLENWEATRFDNLLSDEVYNSLSDEDKEVFLAAKSKSEEKDENGKTLLDRYLDKQHLAANEQIWNAEYAEQIREGKDKAIVQYYSTQQSINLTKDKEQIDDNLDGINNTYKEVVKSNYRYAEDVMKLAYKDGITFDVEQDSKGNNLYKAKGSNGDLVAKYQQMANNIRQKEIDAKNKYTQDRKVELNRYKNWVKANQENNKVLDIARRETDLGNILVNDFNDACSNIGYSIPALFGNEQAINMHQSRQAGKDAYEQALDWNTAAATGQRGRYGLISFNQQLPNILLATATAGTGSALGASTTLASGLTATAFGINSGGAKRADLTIQRNAAEEAKEMLVELEANKDFMSHEEYVQQKANLEEQISFGDLTDGQIIGASIASGIIEGGVAFGLGTIPNASKLVKGIISGPGDDIINAIVQKNMSYYAMAGLEFGKRTLGEVLEEGIIHIGDAASESMILGRDYNIDGWEDVVVSSLITGGVMNGPGIASTAIKNRLVTKDHRAVYNDAKNNIERYKKDLTNPDLTNIEKDILRDQIVEERKKISFLDTDMDVTAMLLGADGVNKLMKNGLILDGLYADADIIPGDSQEVIDKKLKDYSDGLKGEEKTNYDNRLKNALDQKQKLMDSIDYTDGWKIWGPRGELLHQKLMNTDPAYKKMDDRQRTAKIHETIKGQIDQKLISDAKKDESLVNMVNSIVYPEGRKRGRKSKENIAAEDANYLRLARLLRGMTGEMVSKNIDQEINAKSVLSDKRLQGIKTVQVSDKGFEHDIRKMEQDGQLGENESADEIIAEIKSGETAGVIVGNKYIVTDQNAGAAALAEGNLMRGTVFSHEVKHAVDNLAFNPQEMAEYSDNLRIWSEENAPGAHLEAITRLQGNQHLVPGVEWKDQPDIVHREYGNYIQDAIQRKQYKTYRDKINKVKPSIGNRLGGIINADYNVNSPENAAAYLADHMRAFDKGDMSTLAKRRADKRKGTVVDGGVKRSSNLQGILNEGYNGENASKGDVNRMVNNLLSTDFNGEPMVAGSTQLSAFDFEVGGIVEAITKRLYDNIPAENKKTLSRQDYKQTLLNDAAVLIQQEYDASKQDLDKFLSNRLNLRANDLAKRLGVTQQFTSNIDDATNLFVDPDDDVNLDDDGNLMPEETEFSDGLGFSPEAIVVIKDHVTLNLGGILPSVDAEKGKNAVISPLVSELKKLFYKEKNPIQQEIEKLMGKTPQEVEMWLKDPKNKALILKHMPTSWLAKNLPKAVEKLVIQEDGTKIWTTDFVGRKKGTKPGQIDFYRSTDKGPYFGMTDGKQKIRRNPNAMTDVSSVEIIKKFFNGTTMTDLRRGGLNTLTQAMAQEIGLEQFRADVASQGPMSELFAGRQELMHGELADGMVAKIIDQVERGAVLRSEDGNISKAAFLNMDVESVGPIARIGFNLGKDSKLFRDDLAALEGQFPGITEVVDNVIDKLAGENYIKENIGFLKQLKDDPKIPADVKEAIKNFEHKLRDKDGKVNDNAYRYADAIMKVAEEYGFDAELINKLGGDGAIVGFFNRALDSAKNSIKYDGPAPFNATQKRFIKGLQSVNSGFNANDVILINKKNAMLRKMYNDILHSDIDTDLKNQKLAEIRPQLEAAKIANLGKLKELYDTFNQAYQDKNISAVDLITMAQIQTNIVSGTRALSGLDYFMFGNFIDNSKLKFPKPEVEVGSDAWNNFVNELETKDYYQERYDANKKLMKEKNPKLTDTELERATIKRTYEDLSIKGEHIGASANTSFDIIKAIINGEYNDDTVADILEDHTQFFGPNFIMDMLDADLGKTSREGHSRITAALQNTPYIGKIKHISGKPATEVIANKEALKVVFRSKGDLSKAKILENAAKQKRLNTENKGISVLDFDDTLATSKSLIRFVRPDGTKGTLTPEEYAAKYEDLADLGYTFDFSEFNDVIQGKIAPLFNKALKLAGKFGTNDIFVLTARPAAAQKAIFNFLKENGLELPIDNIVGLGNSTAEAKALWIANKAAEGYNDFYFADDALKNVQAVSNMLDQFDVKQKTTVADPNFVLRSKDAAKTLNSMIARNLGVAEYKNYSDAKAKLVGGKKGKYKFFIPPSAEDFKGLLYPLLGKGAQGDADMKFFKDHFFDPFSRGMHQINVMAQNIARDHRALNKALPDAKKKLKKKIPGTEFTHGQAVKVYMWTKAGVDIPGLSKADQKIMMEAVQADPKLMEYANGLTKIVKSPSYIEPTDTWLTSTIAQDLAGMTQNVNRKEMLAEFIENRKAMFGDWKNGRLDGPLMNKLEAELGSNWRSAMEDMLWRMENGSNRNFGTNALTNRFANWVNNSVGAIMFFNGRSAVLQTLSTVNFINWSDNNILMAAKAFANQPQYWKDFAYLFNSDMLKQRRAGNRRSVSESELAEAAAQGGPQAVFKKLLDLGFLPTQIADSFAISAGGATFYRNRVNSLIKQGMSRADAEAQAFTDFQKITEETQQSSRPDMISQQQASPLGRLILAFQNTPMQYTRLTKKAILDLKNGRGDAKTNISKIIYYGAMQNIIFSSLQSAMFKFMFDDEDEEEDKRKRTTRMANSVVDSFLRGTGVTGAIAATLKNMVLKFIEEDKKGFRMSESAIMVEMLNLSPPIGSKMRKIRTGLQTYKFNRDEIDYMSKWDFDNPMWSTVALTVSALTNVPLDRVYQKITNLKEASNSDHETWQRIALMLGWNTWDLGVENQALKNVEEGIKAEKEEQKRIEKEAEKKEKERKRKEREARMTQCTAHTRKGKGPRCKNMTENKSGKCYAHQ